MNDPHRPDPVDSLAELTIAVRRLRVEVDDLRRQNEHLRVVARLDESDESPSRRTVLRTVAATVVGAGIAVIGGSTREAAAATGDAVQAGYTNPTDRTTRLEYGTGSAIASGPPALGTTVPFVDIDGSAIPTSVGVQATGSQWGVLARGDSAGVASYGRDYGFASVLSSKAGLYLGALGPGNSPKLAPPARTDQHSAGELDVDADANLWYCATSGTPGTWKRLAGPGAGGTFTPVGPHRVYDSRAALPLPGTLASGQSRLIPAGDARSLDDGTVTTANVIPVGATAISCNIGVVDTENSGFISVNPGGDNVVRSASINWFGSGQILNNGIIVKINAARQITAIAGGGGTTNLVVDVTGYFA